MAWLFGGRAKADAGQQQRQNGLSEVARHRLPRARPGGERPPASRPAIAAAPAGHGHLVGRGAPVPAGF